MNCTWEGTILDEKGVRTVVQSRNIEPFREPVDQVEALLGYSLQKERPALVELCGLIQKYRPQKIVKTGSVDDVNLLVMLKCIQMLQIDSRIYVADLLEDIYLKIHVESHLKQGLKLCALDLNNCVLLTGHTLAASISEVGSGIDFLLLDAVDNMPDDILNFMAAFPYMSPDGVVVLYDAVFTRKNAGTPTNVLFQNVCARKFPCAPELSLNWLEKIPVVSQYTAMSFQINESTAGRMKDLFALLNGPWSHVPRLAHMMEYADLFKEHYGAECLSIYRAALFGKEAYWGVLEDMANSLISSFCHVLLYGKGKRGRCFLKAAELLGMNVHGFIVSDGRSTEKSAYGLPVYAYSAIPFPKEEVFIIQSVYSEEVERVLKSSGYHWLKLPESFWEES